MYFKGLNCLINWKGKVEGRVGWGRGGEEEEGVSAKIICTLSLQRRFNGKASLCLTPVF